ncbi:MAG: class I SAM-dependent methyltransferase, partial [Candidatus Omnitrophota bacterium]
KYMKEYSSIYEFGCGTGFNLATLANIFPEKSLYGSDFVPAPRDMINKMAETYDWKISGHLFNMIEPDKEFTIAENSVIFTFGSIEQLAGRFEAFLQYLLTNKPKLCMHLEPTIELYDENNLFDYLAIKFHKKRGYTQNYLNRLRELEKEGKLEIVSVKRLNFGSLMMEGFTYIVWKPSK